MKSKQYPKLIWIKGNGPININNEMMELFSITTSHGMVGLPLKSLNAEMVYIVKQLEDFFEIHKLIKKKPCCFIYCEQGLGKSDEALISCKSIEYI